MDSYREPKFFRVMQYAARADRDVVDMVSGSPDWAPPPALREGLREYADLDPDEFQYPPSVGLTELRDEIAQHGYRVQDTPEGTHLLELRS
jgi:aspartate/methionine/tyrosine aminotransferase